MKRDKKQGAPQRTVSSIQCSVFSIQRERLIKRCLGFFSGYCRVRARGLQVLAYRPGTLTGQGLGVCVLIAIAALCVPITRAFDTTAGDFEGLRFIEYPNDQMRAGGLSWYVYAEKDGCRLAKPLAACFGREFDLELQKFADTPNHPHVRWRKLPDFGLVRPAEGKVKLNEFLSSWTSATAVYAGARGEIRVTASRLTPAVLIETRGEIVEIFADAGFRRFACGGSNPVGFEEVEDMLAKEDEGWFLAWFGSDSPFYGLGQHPDFVKADVRMDMPVLVVYSDTVLTIEQSRGAGLAFDFGGDEGAVAIMPLLGDMPVLVSAAKRHSGESRRDIRAADVTPTSEWKDAVPAQIIEQCRFWAKRLAEFPVAVRETSRYDAENDAIVIEVSHTFKTLREDGVRFAPVSPMLALARWGGLGVEFAKEPVDSGLVTSVGPYLGVDDADGYSYSIRGLGRYVRETRKFGPDDKVPAGLRERFDREIDMAVEAGVMAPWILSMQPLPHGAVYTYLTDSNRLFHGHPGENLYFLAQFMQVCDAGRREKLAQLIEAWEGKYPCLHTVHMPAVGDARREGYAVPLDRFQDWPMQEKNFHYIHRIMPAETLYWYGVYTDALGKTPDAAAVSLLDPYLGKNEWATGGSFRWETNYVSGEFDSAFLDKEYGWSGCSDANRLFSGLLAGLRICRQAKDAADEDRLWYHFGKTAALRLAMEKYRDFLYARGMLSPPADQLELKYGRVGTGIHTFSRKGPEDDPLSVYVCDEYGVWAEETPHHIGVGVVRIPPYLGMTPELGRFLRDHAPRVADAYCRKIEESTPDWYIVLGENNWIGETDYLYPSDVHQFFMARAWIAGQDAETLERYADLSWLARGDFFYIHKLAETIKAYRGVKWE